MAFKKLESKSSDGFADKFKFDKVGASLTGNYLGSEVIDINGKAVLKHTFKTADGKLVAPLGSTDLNRQLEQVSPGAMLRVTFSEEKKIKGRPVAMKIYSVEIDETASISVEAPSTKVRAAAPEAKRLA